MQYIYFGTAFAAMFIYLLAGLLLLMQRKRGERSRMILAGMNLLSVLNYVGLLVYFYIDPAYGSGSVMDVPFLLIGIFVITIYFIYPIEVASPGWITWRRLLKMYIPAIGLSLFYSLTLLLGVEYTLYPTFGDIIADSWSFQVIFRIVLALLLFLPAVLLYYVPFTRRYNNTNRKWMNGYNAGVVINMVAYLVANIIDTFLVCAIYIIIGISCSLYFTYQELYVRLIRQLINEPQSAAEIEPEALPESADDARDSPKLKESELFERLEKYVNSRKAWRDPDLSAGTIVSALYTNRTSMLKALQRHSYSGYSSYVNGKRVAEFIQIINKEGGLNYQQTLFDVGFRSKTTALRNFRKITGMTPSEYFQKQTRGE